jgi:hypothetical protein
VGSTVMARENVARSEMVGGDSLEPRQLSGVVGLGQMSRRQWACLIGWATLLCGLDPVNYLPLFQNILIDSIL